MEEEIWKQVIGYEGLYEVSNIGRIKSVERLVKTYKGTRIVKENIRNGHIDSNGYMSFTLSKNSITKPKRVHLIVAESFLNHTSSHKIVINHKNFIKTDNRLSNLEIVTQRENANRKHITHSSRYTGVRWDNNSNKWKAQISIKNKSVHLGYFDTEKQASEYYENAVKAVKYGNEIVVFKDANSHRNLKKKVYQYKNGIKIAEYKSVTDASIYTGISRVSIGAVCRVKHRHSAGGFEWKYAIK